MHNCATKFLYLAGVLSIAVSSPVQSVNIATGSNLDARAHGIGCDDIMINKEQTDKAVNDFYAVCQGKQQSIFTYVGDTVVFYCQWHPGPQCAVTSASHQFEMITSQCGLYGVSRRTA
ncbi:unnamed protein product [Cercospora beticola]|nr:unnamed protein product [Cercospora beticola]